MFRTGNLLGSSNFYHWSVLLTPWHCSGDDMLRTESAAQVDFAAGRLSLSAACETKVGPCGKGRPMVSNIQKQRLQHEAMEPGWNQDGTRSTWGMDGMDSAQVVLLTPLNEGLFIINSLGAPGGKQFCPNPIGCYCLSNQAGFQKWSAQQRKDAFKSIPNVYPSENPDGFMFVFTSKPATGYMSIWSCESSFATEADLKISRW